MGVTHVEVASTSQCMPAYAEEGSEAENASPASDRLGPARISSDQLRPQGGYINDR
ncbi:hypothetical protein FACS189449_10860 [Alphaproteobacteria bacterium]|nr:hypothetical protein FACS189449_10860 [Alphaproteobacteria bacterium]